MVASLAQDIFKELAQIEGCQGPMQMRLIPTLVSIMQAPPDKIPSGLCAVSVQGHKKTQVYEKSQLSEVGINVFFISQAVHSNNDEVSHSVLLWSRKRCLSN